MDDQILDMLNTRFDSLDKRFDTVEESNKTQVALLHCIDKKVAINATHIRWIRWSVRGAWTAIAASIGWGLR